MQQMLNALLSQAAGGEGEGGSGGVGGGGGGAGQDGYSVAGSTASLPAYGPDRLTFSQSQAALAKSGGKGGKGRGKPAPIATQGQSAVSADDYREPTTTTISSENIPPKYREAVKRYFSIDDPS